MTREDVIRMALEHFGAVLKPSDLEVKLAALVAAAEREKVAAWMRARSYATGHGDTVEDLLKELEWQVAEREREACARIADKCIEDSQKVTPESEQEENYLTAMRVLSEEFAIAIRARGNT